jgi:hypothetical protein
MPADAPVLVEDVLIAKLLTLSAVTAIVGTRIRPGVLAQSDTIPAVTVIVAQEIAETDLDDSGEGETLAGPFETITVEVCAIASTHRAARLLQKAIELNGTRPGSGLNGFRSGAVASCVKESMVRELVDLKDDAGGKREIMRTRYSIMFIEPVG